MPCSFNVPFRDWAIASDQCKPGEMLTCCTDADCAALPKNCCPHYGPGPSPGCGWLHCLETGPPFATGKVCGLHRLSPAGTCKRDGSLCGVELATGNVGCFSNSTCNNPSAMAPKLACFPDGHAAENATENEQLVAHRSQIGPGEAFGAWTSKPRIRDRWNTLLRLVAKRRHMPDVFEVCDARRACWSSQDHSTTEFIARAAVATVNMTGLVDSFHAMPAPRFPEVVFLGWSNVGKSSLINALLHRTAVAPVSNMPGKTTQFHFYSINEKNAAFPQMTLVDVPGLGEAMADEAQTRHWRSTLDLYLKRRGNMLRQVFHLISCEVLLRRKRPSLLDMAVMEMCLRHRRDSEYTIVITKVDLIKSEEAMEKHWHMFLHWDDPRFGPTPCQDCFPNHATYLSKNVRKTRHSPRQDHSLQREAHPRPHSSLAETLEVGGP
eukprot:g6444.t1